MWENCYTLTIINCKIATQKSGVTSYYHSYTGRQKEEAGFSGALDKSWSNGGGTRQRWSCCLRHLGKQRKRKRNSNSRRLIDVDAWRFLIGVSFTSVCILLQKVNERGRQREAHEHTHRHTCTHAHTHVHYGAGLPCIMFQSPSCSWTHLEATCQRSLGNLTHRSQRLSGVS